MTKVAAVQMVPTPDVNENMATCARLLAEAAALGAELVTLPEYWPIMGMKDADKVAHAEEPGAGPIQQFIAPQAVKRRGITIAARRIQDNLPAVGDGYFDLCNFF